MAYIRYGTPLPSGKTSASFVIGGPDALVSFNEGSSAISYPELVNLFTTKAYPEIQQTVRERLLLSDEEADIVCELLSSEHKAGAWDEVPKWSREKGRE